jgi:hypothetical protein
MSLWDGAAWKILRCQRDLPSQDPKLDNIFQTAKQKDHILGAGSWSTSWDPEVHKVGGQRWTTVDILQGLGRYGYSQSLLSPSYDANLQPAVQRAKMLDEARCKGVFSSRCDHQSPRASKKRIGREFTVA